LNKSLKVLNKSKMS